MTAATKIVYIEDNRDNFRLVQRLLEVTGRYEVLWAQSGLSGLASTREHRPALVLVDLDLPDIDGLDLARQLRADQELGDIPLIAISANVMHDERRRALDAGCLAFVEKPIDINDFRKLIDEHID